MEKKLYLAYDNRRSSSHQDWPIGYIFADDEDSAKIKALDILQEEWEKGRIGHDKFYRETLGYGPKKNIPCYEKQNGVKPMNIEDIYVLHPKDEIYVI